MVLGTGLALFFVWRGHYVIGNQLVVGAAWLAMTAQLFQAGNLGEPAFGLSVMAIFVGGLALGRRTAFLLAVLSMLSGGLVGYRQVQLGRVPDVSGIPVRHVWYAWSVAFAATAALVAVVRRRMGDALAMARQNEERFRSIADNTFDLIMEFDEAGRMLYGSVNFRNMLGHEPDALVGNGYAELIHEEDVKRVAGELSAGRVFVSDGASCRCSFRARHASGDWRHIEGTYRTYTGADGRLRTAGVWRDVTERFELERRLRHSQKMDAMGQLVGGVAHDFNNLLQGILSYGEMLRASLPAGSSEQQDAIKIVETGGRASDLIRKLLAFSRQTEGSRPVFQVHNLMDETIELVRHSVDRRIVIERDLAAADDRISGDPGLIQSALLNLALNARDAMPRGGTLRFATRNRAIGAQDMRMSELPVAPGRYIEIAVSDTGTGIPPELQQKVFEPFFTTKPTGKGTGLGLSAVYGTVRDHGGGILVESLPGTGATFRLLFPLHSAVPEKEVPADQPDRLTRGTGRVLIIEDEPVIREVLKKVLEDLGYEVVAATDGEDGIQVFARESGRFDAVVLDMIMPKLSGADVFRHLRKQRESLPILLVTGFADEAELEALKGLPPVAVIRKPFALVDIAGVLGQLLGTKAAGEGNAK